MGPLGIPEMIFIFVFALVIFGPKKLPELGRTFGKGMAEFRRASNELKSTFQREMDNIERETRMDEAKKAAAQANKAMKDATHFYEDDEDDYYDYNRPKALAKPAESETGSSSESTSDANTDAPSSDSAPSPGESTDSSAEPAAETSSTDRSSNGSATAATVPREEKKSPSPDDAETEKSPA